MKTSFSELWSASKITMHGHWCHAMLVTWAVSLAVFAAGFIPRIGGLSGLLLFPLSAGVWLYFLRLSRRQEAVFGTVFQPFRQYWRWLWAMLRVSIFVMLWSLLLIVPGIIAGYRYSMTFFLLLDHPEMTVKEAMKESSRLMKGNKARLFGYGMIFLLLIWASLLTLGIALIWLVPWLHVFMVHFYRDLALPPVPFAGNASAEAVQ